MKKEATLKMTGAVVILFIAFVSYRLYFWGEPEKHGLQSSLNALADVVFSAACGLLVYRLQQKSGNRRWFPVVLLLAGLGFSGLLYLAHRLIYSGFGMLNPDFLGFFNSICFQLLDSVAIVVCGAFTVINLKQQVEKSSMSRNLKMLEYEKKTAELKYLKAQMDPHFVFNGLNMIYQQIPVTNSEARESMVQFCSILRYHMQYASHETISIEEEVAYLRSYIHFQKKRCSEFMDIEAHFEVSEEALNIEPLILLPLVENAFKFCEGNDGKKGLLKLNLDFRDQKLAFDIQNTTGREGAKKVAGHGLGLANVKKRLNLLYPGKHSLLFGRNNGDMMYTCKLELWGTN